MCSGGWIGDQSNRSPRFASNVHLFGGDTRLATRLTCVTSTRFIPASDFNFDELCLHTLSLSISGKGVISEGRDFLTVDYSASFESFRNGTIYVVPCHAPGGRKVDRDQRCYWSPSPLSSQKKKLTVSVRLQTGQICDCGQRSGKYIPSVSLLPGPPKETRTPARRS